MKNRKHLNQNLRIGLILICLHVIIAAISSFHKSYTYDEPNHLRYGRQIINEGKFDKFDNSKMPVSAINAIAEKFAVRILGFRDHQWIRLVARFPTMVMGSFIGLIAFWWAGYLYGDRAAWIAWLLCLSNPNILAHMRLITTDVPVTMATFLLFFAIFMFTATRKQSFFVIAVVAMGLSLVSKYNSGLVGLVISLLLIFPYRCISEDDLKYKKFRFSIGQRLSIFVVFWILVVLFVWTVYGFKGIGLKTGQINWHSDFTRNLIQQHPNIVLPLPAPYLEGLDWCFYDDTRPVEVYFHGRKYTEPVRAYYPVLLILKTPAGQLILVILSLWSLFKYRDLRRPSLFLWSLVFSWLLPAVFLLRSQLGVRFLLPVYPLLAMLGASIFTSKLPAVYHRMGWFCILWQLGSVASFFPHLLPYSNELAGDRKLFYRYFADSNIDWGQDQEIIHPQTQKYHGHMFSLSPSNPVPGIICVPVNDLVGIIAPFEQYAWIRTALTPFTSIGYSYMLFNVPVETYITSTAPRRIRPLHESIDSLPDGFSQKKFKGIQYNELIEEQVVPKLPDLTEKSFSDEKLLFIEWSRNFILNETGTYVFAVESDDGSQVFLNEILLIDNSGIHGCQTRAAAVKVYKGLYSIRIRYDDRGGNRLFKLYAYKIINGTSIPVEITAQM